jgi:hypothetical protein
MPQPSLTPHKNKSIKFRPDVHREEVRRAGADRALAGASDAVMMQIR